MINMKSVYIIVRSIVVKIIYKMPLLKKILWKMYQQNFEFKFHTAAGRKFRESPEFLLQTKRLFTNWGYRTDQFKEKIIVDVSAGSKLRSSFFVGSLIYAIEPLAERFKKLSFSDLFECEKVYGVSAEQYIPELEGKANFIICINVLDHVIDPLKVLENCYHYLHRNGDFLISTDLHQHVVSPSHPIGFSKKFLLNLVKTTGFKVMRNFLDRSYGDSGEQQLTLVLRKINHS